MSSTSINCRKCKNVITVSSTKGTFVCPFCYTQFEIASKNTTIDRFFEKFGIQTGSEQRGVHKKSPSYSDLAKCYNEQKQETIKLKEAYLTMKNVLDSKIRIIEQYEKEKAVSVITLTALQKNSSACSKCKVNMPHTHLFLCHNSKCKDIEQKFTADNPFQLAVKMIENALCGVCAMSHFVEHAEDVKMALEVAIESAAKEAEQFYWLKIDTVFLSYFGSSNVASVELDSFRNKLLENLPKNEIYVLMRTTRSIEKLSEQCKKMEDMISMVTSQCENMLKFIETRDNMLEDLIQRTIKNGLKSADSKEEHKKT